MTRTQFLVLTSLSALVAALFLLQIAIMRLAQGDQSRLLQARAVISQGQACDQRMRQLATRVYQVAQQTQDPGLKDLLTRQQIVISANPAADAAAAPAADSSTPSTNH